MDCDPIVAINECINTWIEIKGCGVKCARLAIYGACAGRLLNDDTRRRRPNDPLERTVGELAFTQCVRDDGVARTTPGPSR
jgi:hypothetical protein